MNSIAVFLAEGFEEIEAVSIIDVLRRATIETLVVSVTGNLEIKGSHGIIVKADVLFEEVDFSRVEGMLLPGGMPGSQNLKNHEALRQRLTEFNHERKLLGAICAAPIVLGELGILDHKNATCYPGFNQFLGLANLKDTSVEEDQNVVTGRGAGVAVQFALKIVERLKGRELADTTGRKMMLPHYDQIAFS
jgi:protein deglycase